ncbi:MAG: TolC family protein [Verrucomicrobiota bacterium]
MAAEGSSALTLEQALASVERVNLNVLLSRETAAQAVETAAGQRGALLPIIGATVQQRRQQQVSIGTVVTSSGRPTSRFDALLTSSWSLFDPELIATVRGARLGAQAAQANYQAVVQTVLADVAEGYFAHLRNQRRLAVLDANITRARSLFTLARNQLEAGIVTQIDVTRADAQVAQAEQARLQQLTALVASELFLKRLLELPTVGELRLEEFQVRRVEPSLFVFSEQKTAFEHRAEYLAAQKNLEQAKAAVRASGFQRLPALGVTANYGEASPKYDDSDKQEQWNVTLGLSVPLFDLRLGTDKRIALSRQRAQEARVRNLELQITAELRLALQDAGSRNAQIAVAEKSLALAREELRLAQQRYQQGVADNREVVDAQNRLAIAEDNQVEAIYQYNLSRVELARTKGDVRGVLAEKAP